MKQRVQGKEVSRRRKSQQAFITKAKMNSQLTEQLRYLHPKKYQPRIAPPEASRTEALKRMSSLDLGGELAVIEEARPSKSTTNNRSRKNIAHCLSERNITPTPQPNKLFKYRKFSSNAQLQQQEHLEHRRKLSLVDERPDLPVPETPVKLNATGWLIFLRRLFVDEYRKRGATGVRLGLVLSYVQKAERSGLNDVGMGLQSLDYELELTAQQLTLTLQQFFAKQQKDPKKEIPKVQYLDLFNCLLQTQIKQVNPKYKPRSSSSEDHEEPVETARFQEGTEEGKRARRQEYSLWLMEATPAGKENLKASLNVSAADSRILQSLSTSNAQCNSSPFATANCRSFALSRMCEQQGVCGQSLGMLTLQGRSPRELMESEIFESMQKLGVSGQRNNVSFSLDQLEAEPHLSFEQTVQSFEEILRKIKRIQGGYRGEGGEVNSFLEQLIGYRMSGGWGDEGYGYVVGISNIGQLKEHNQKIITALLQSAYMKEYFAALQGLKIDNSPHLLRTLVPLFSPLLRLLNLANNALPISPLDSLVSTPALLLLNLSHNQLTQLPLLARFPQLRELHACHNRIKHLQSEPADNPHLRIIDLGGNRIEKQSELGCLRCLPQLQLVNLRGNPLVLGEWRGRWGGVLGAGCVYEMEDVYVMSQFGHLKDIAFTVGVERRGEEGPKQKISRIKTYLDGRAV